MSKKTNAEIAGVLLEGREVVFGKCFAKGKVLAFGAIGETAKKMLKSGQEQLEVKPGDVLEMSFDMKVTITAPFGDILDREVALVFVDKEEE
jgi:hypothetical protein